MWDYLQYYHKYTINNLSVLNFFKYDVYHKYQYMASVWYNMSVNKSGYIHINPDNTFSLHFGYSHTLRQCFCPAKYNNECAFFQSSNKFALWDGV